MLVPSGTLVAAFVCEDSTGAPTAPTGTPTGVLYKNGSSTAETVTVTMSTAVGVAVATIPSNAVQGDVFHITVTGTVSGAEYKASSKPETVFAATVPVDVLKISGDATAADNLEAAADGTGYNLGGGSIVAASVTGSVGSVGSGVTVTTNNDKTGYSLSQSFPANFASLAITGGGAVTAGTVSDKTGYSLATAPLDAAGVRAAVGLATNNLDTQLGLLATASALSALVTTVGVAGAGLTEAGGTGDQFTALPRVGATLRYTQVAANSGSKTADVSIGAAT